MKRYMQWMAAILIISGSMVLTSCSDDEVTETRTGTGTENYELPEPATDQMDVTVTYPLTAASLSQFAEPSTGAALIRRLPKATAAITDDTRMVLLKGSDAGSLSYGEIAAMVDVLANNGYLAIETPTEKQLDTFLDQLDKAIAEYVASYVNDEFELTSEQMQAFFFDLNHCNGGGSRPSCCRDGGSGGSTFPCSRGAGSFAADGCRRPAGQGPTCLP